MHTIIDECENDDTRRPRTPPSNHGSFGTETSLWYHSPTNKKKRHRPSVLGHPRSDSDDSRFDLRLPSMAVTSETKSSRQLSHEWRSFQGRSRCAPQNSIIKTSLARGSQILRKHRSKLSMRIRLIDDNANFGPVKVSETCSRPQHCPLRSKRLNEEGNKQISTPFDFHHITHTQRLHFENLDRGSDDDLITEFVAIRASQRPRTTLQGIRAEDLHRNNRRKVSNAVDTDAHHASNQRRSTSRSCSSISTMSPSTRQSFPSSRLKSVRSLSIENFSRPTPYTSVSERASPARQSSSVECFLPSTPAASTIICDDRPEVQSDRGILARGRPTLNLNPSITSDMRTPRFQNVDVDSSLEQFDKFPHPVSGSRESSESRSNFGLSKQPAAEEMVSPSSTTMLRLNVAALGDVCSLDGHCHPLGNELYATKARSEAPRRRLGVSWTDLDGYHQNAAKAISSIDWSERTVFVDEEAASSTISSSEDRHVNAPASDGSGEPLSRTDGQRSETSTSDTVASCRNSHDSPKIATELQDRFLPSAQQQSESEFRGNRAWSPAPSKPTGKLRVVLEDFCAGDDLTFPRELYDVTETNVTTDVDSPTEQCYLGSPSHFQATSGSLNKYRSEGSILSSDASTIRTYQSSSSLRSVPDLVFSGGSSSGESVAVDKASLMSPPSPISPVSLAGGAVSGLSQNGRYSTRKVSSRSRRDVQLSKLPPIPCLPPTISLGPLRNSVRKGQMLGASADIKLTENPNELVSGRPGPVAVRKRSAKSATPGNSVIRQSSYSIFPNQPSSGRTT